MALSALDGAMCRSVLNAVKSAGRVEAGDNLDRAIADVRRAVRALSEHRAVTERPEAA